MLHILYEHASGYSLFRVKEFEEVAMLQPELEESVHDLSRFNSVVKLIAFAPFKSGTNALDNINSVSEGKLVACTNVTFPFNMYEITKVRRKLSLPYCPLFLSFYLC